MKYELEPHICEPYLKYQAHAQLVHNRFIGREIH